MAYLLLCWVCAFLFELQIDFSLFGCLFFSWLFMRLFMVTKSTPPNQIGDSTGAFALSTFFPEKVQPTVDWMCKVCYKVANLCKIVDGMQSCLKKRQIAKAKTKAENRKKALKMIQKEIEEGDEERGVACDDKEDGPSVNVPLRKKPQNEEEEWEQAIEDDKNAADAKVEEEPVVRDEADEDEFDEIEI